MAKPERKPDTLGWLLGCACVMSCVGCCIGFLWLIGLSVWTGVSSGNSSSGGGSSVDPKIQQEVNYILDVFNICDINNGSCPVNNVTELEIQVQNNTEILSNCNLTLDSCGGVQGPPGANGTCTDEQCNSTTLWQDIQEINATLVACGITNETCPTNCWECSVSFDCPSRRIAIYKPTGSGEANQDIGFTRLGTGAFTITEDGNYGSCRGDYAIDFQRFRTNPDQVASASYSVQLNGVSNLNAGEYSVLGNGIDNTIRSERCLLGTGIGNNISTSSTDSSILVGQNNLILDAPDTVILGGSGCQAVQTSNTLFFGRHLRSIGNNNRPFVAIGDYNDPTVTHPAEQTMFAIGAGDSDVLRKNVFTVSDIGHVRVASTGSFTIGGAYAASMWLEHNETRRLKWGSTVSLLENGKFRESLPGETPDFVVVPPHNGFISNAAEEHWQYKFIINEETMRHEVNPLYKSHLRYIPRSKRSEWHVVLKTGFVEVLLRAAKNYGRWIHLPQKKTTDPLKTWWYIP